MNVTVYTTLYSGTASKQYKEPSSIKQLNFHHLLFVYDRGYTSIEFMGQHKELGVKFLFRVYSSNYKKLWRRATNGESDFEDIIHGIPVRVV
jgi:hypothetical protein